ncbi:MAG: S-methyl-5-thioribose-1-phosphate isomerase, partial [Actinobacteria bacterium]
MEPPLRWVDNGLELLDQTRLPDGTTWIRCESAEEVAGAIRRLAVRGAPLIGLAAAYGAVLGMRSIGEPDDAAARFEQVARLLAGSRPTAANLGWALDRGREVV